jgi:hypothetical protein
MIVYNLILVAIFGLMFYLFWMVCGSPSLKSIFGFFIGEKTKRL